MRVRETKLTPLLRSFAAATLLVWVAALTFCTAHCSLGVGHDDGDHASCHGSVPAQSHHDGGDSRAPVHNDSSTSASCLTFKTGLVNRGSLDLVQPELPVLYAFVPFALAFNLTATEPEAPASRQANLRDWVLTPEVSLGPAFRSHAPPLLS